MFHQKREWFSNKSHLQAPHGPSFLHSCAMQGVYGMVPVKGTVRTEQLILGLQLDLIFIKVFSNPNA